MKICQELQVVILIKQWIASLLSSSSIQWFHHGDIVPVLGLRGGKVCMAAFNALGFTLVKCSFGLCQGLWMFWEVLRIQEITGQPPLEDGQWPAWLCEKLRSDSPQNHQKITRVSLSRRAVGSGFIQQIILLSRLPTSYFINNKKEKTTKEEYN